MNRKADLDCSYYLLSMQPSLKAENLLSISLALQHLYVDAVAFGVLRKI